VKSLSKFSIKDYQIYWNKKVRTSKRKRQRIKKSLEEKAEKIVECMETTKREMLNGRVYEMRLPLFSDSDQDFYLAIEAGTDARHLILETDKDCLGEIVRKGGSFIKMLEDKDIEVDTA
jgi:hypothetical protein